MINIHSFGEKKYLKSWIEKSYSVTDISYSILGVTLCIRQKIWLVPELEKSTMAFHSSGAGKPKGREKSCVPALLRVYNKFWIWGVNIFFEPISAEPKFVGHMENITVDAGTAKVTFTCTVTNIGGHKVSNNYIR